MTDGKTFREAVREEINKLKKMNFREKRQHIWEYYRVHMVILAVVIALLVSIINWLVNPPPDDYLYIAWLGPPAVPHMMLDELTEKLDEIVENPERQQVQATSYAIVDGFPPSSIQAIQTRFAALLHAGEMDIILTAREGVLEVYEMGWIQPLDEVRNALREINASLYNRLDEMLVTIGNGEPRVMALDLSGSPLFAEIGFDTSNLYLTMVGNSERYHEIAQALEVMFK